MKRRLRKYVLLFAFAALLVPRPSSAGVADIARRLADWWHAKSLGVVALTAGEQGGAATPGEGSGGGTAATPGETPAGGTGAPAGGSGDGGATAAPGMCIVPQSPPVTQCDIGAGFLCVDTPPGSIAGDTLLLRGTIDRQSSVLASIRIAAQNEYTKRTSIVDTSNPDDTNCWDEGQQGRPFCLDRDGHFSASVSLSDRGPYTIVLSASRFSGESVERSVRVTSAIAPTLVADGITFDPDVRAKPQVDASHVTVTVKLLGDCQFCDFIGASTGGVTVTVENVIHDAAGAERRVSCGTTVEQGGQGQFVVGVPVSSGENALTVRACNAVASANNCPTVGGVTFQGTGAGAGAGVEGFEMLSPPPAPTYDASAFPTIPWSFRLGEGGACVTMRFNREASEQLCPDAQGVYRAELTPALGINVASLAHEEESEEYAWTFGWGKVESPAASGEGRLAVPSAFELAVPAHTVQEILLPFINHFLASDERAAFIARVLAPAPAAPAAGGGAPADDGIAALIPKCGGAGATQAFKVALRGEPTIGTAVLEGLTFDAQQMGLAVTLEHATIGMDLTTKPELPPLPLTIGIRKAKLDLLLTSDVASDGQPLVLLGSLHDDCEFKDSVYCRHKPAALVPANLVGDATPWGSFLRCEAQEAEGEAKSACDAINSLNAQTGVVSEKVLDAINNALYCGVSTSLTRLARGGTAFSPLAIGCPDGERCAGILGALPRVTIPLAVNLASGLDISKDGILLNAGLGVGSTETYAQTPSAARIPTAGFIPGKAPGARALAGAGAGGSDLGIAVSLDALNALLFAATAQGDGRTSRGLLDLDVHEPFFNALGFDFVKECDAFVPVPGGKTEPPTLCNLRPRVGELLGSALTSYGYLPGKHPLLAAVRGNRALGMRLAAALPADVPVVELGGASAAAPTASATSNAAEPTGPLLSVDIGGLQLSFYALEVDTSQAADEYGNVKVKLDAQGKPVIRSMRPEDADPWNGPIVRFDLTLLLALEIGDPEADPKDPKRFLLPLSILGDRSRLVLTPVPGSNATTVPAASLVSALGEKLKLGISAFAAQDKKGAIKIPVPREIAFAAADDGTFTALGLKQIEIGGQGLSLTLDPAKDKITAAVSAVLTQLLHQGGKEVTFQIPQQ